jgi:uncharacterized protein YutE (UPF0331/DUF86 family)
LIFRIAKVVLPGENVPIPEKYREMFLVLGELGLISQEVAVQISVYSRLRNVLAHQYLDIRWEVVKDFLLNGFEVISSFFDSVENIIAKS